MPKPPPVDVEYDDLEIQDNFRLLSHLSEHEKIIEDERPDGPESVEGVVGDDLDVGLG